VVVVMVIGGALTGPIGSLSAAWLTVIAATARMGANLDEVVGDHEPNFGEQGGVVVTKICDGDTHAWSAHRFNIAL
jgi:hypothetical protein